MKTKSRLSLCIRNAIALFWCAWLCLPPSGTAAEGVTGEFAYPYSAGTVATMAYPTLINVKTCCGAVADGVTDDYSAITNAIGLCSPSNAVFFPKGTYISRTPIKLGSFHGISYLDKPIELLGEDPTNTILRGELTGGLASTIYARGGQYGSDLMIASGGTLGSSNITLFSVAGISVGDTGRFAKSNDVAKVFGWTPSGSSDDTKDQYAAHGQISRIVSITGTNIVIDQPLCEDLTGGFFRKFAPYRGFGMRNMGFSNTNLDTSAAAVYLYGVEEGWMTNCIIHGYNTYGIQLHKGNHFSIVRNWIKDAGKRTSSVYGTHFLTATCNSLFANNRMGKASAGFVLQEAASLNVAFGNYAIDTYPYDWRGDGPQDCLAAAILCHGYAPHHNLIEGNLVDKITLDNVWGVNRYITIYRNWLTRTDPTLTEPDLISSCVNGIQVESTNRYVLALGNVIGMAAQAGSGKASFSYDAATTNTVTSARNLLFEDGTTNSFFGLVITNLAASLAYPSGTSPISYGYSLPYFGDDVSNKTNTWPPMIAVQDYYGLPVGVLPPPPSPTGLGPNLFVPKRGIKNPNL